MSRTHHAIDKSYLHSNKAGRTSLTKGKGAGEYTPGSYDLSDQKGGGKGWALWLRNFCGYAKQRKRRRTRKVMKKAGRKADRQRQKQRLEEEML